MATYIWTGLISTDITAGANWAGGVAPVGAHDTEVIIGHIPTYPDHTITNWPTGGHLDMEISKLNISPSWGTQSGASGTIKIGSSSNPLKISKTKQCIWGSMWSPDIFINDKSETYIHMEQWDEGPNSLLGLWGKTEEGTSSPHTPNASLTILGSPYYFDFKTLVGVDVTYDTATSNIAGGVPTTAQNGPIWGTGHEQHNNEGLAYCLTNCKLTLDWQKGTNGGNAIRRTWIDAMQSTVTIAADTWTEVADDERPCLTLIATGSLIDEQLPDEAGNKYYIKSTEVVGGDTAALDIPSLHLTGYDYSASWGIPRENVTKLYIQAGVTIGGQATGSGLECKLFDIIFSPEAAKPTIIKSGTIYYRSRLDASDLGLGDFKMFNTDTGEGIKLVPWAYTWGGAEAGGSLKIKPPKYSNMRIS